MNLQTPLVPKVVILEVHRGLSEDAPAQLAFRDHDHPSGETLPYAVYLTRYGWPVGPGQLLKLEQVTRPIGLPKPFCFNAEPEEPKAPDPKALKRKLFHRGPKSSLPEERIRELAKTKTVREIAEDIGCNQGSLRCFLNRNGIKVLNQFDRNKKTWRAEQGAKLAEMAKTMTALQITKALGMNHRTVYWQLKRMGIKAVPGKRGPKAEQ